MENYPNVFIMDHPLIQHKLTFLRDVSTGTKNFRELVSEIATLMCYEATRDLPLMDVETVTPYGKNGDPGDCRTQACLCTYSARRPGHGGRHAGISALGKSGPHWPLS